jgi:hypothetical protein
MLGGSVIGFWLVPVLGKETLAAISLELITAGRLSLDVCAKDKAAGQTGHKYM